MFVYPVDIGAGERDVVSMLTADWVFQHGLHPEAIMGIIREGADADGLAPIDVRENPTFLRLLSRVIFENIGEAALQRRLHARSTVE